MSTAAAQTRQERRREEREEAARTRSHVMRWRLREASRALARSKNQQKCGLVRRQEDVEIWRQDDTGRAHYRGLVTCGSWSACPVCAHRIGVRRGEEIQQALEEWERRGGEAYLITLTIRHDAGGDLAEMRDAIAEAWSFMRSGGGWAGTKTFEGWRNKLGGPRFLRAIDCTHGPNGWHPHLHVLMLLPGRPWWEGERREREQLLAEFRSWLSARWRRRIAQKLGPEYEPDDEHGVHMQQGDNAGWYVAKLGLARELSQVESKRGRAGHRTPWQILADVARHRRPADRMLWLQWREAMHGRAQISWDKGLRRELLGEERERSDVELLEERLEREHVVYALPSYLWDRIASVRLAPAALLDSAEQGGTIGVERAIRRLMPRLPVLPHRTLRELQADQDMAEQAIRFRTLGARLARARREAGIRPVGVWEAGGTLWRPRRDTWEPPPGSRLWNDLYGE